jgi:hypothetical protein
LLMCLKAVTKQRLLSLCLFRGSCLATGLYATIYFGPYLGDPQIILPN